MNLRVDETTAALAVGLGAYVALAGLATLVGMPWQHQSGAGITAGRIVGALLTAGVGVGVAWLAFRP